MNFRVGNGYDVHQTRQSIPLVLGGVKIESNYGCVSNSDGDVLTHAVIDSLLGATGKGDIGKYFSPKDHSYKGTSSLDLLVQTLKIIGNIEIINLDCVVVAQEPNLSPYREKIENSLSKTCGIDKDRVNIKFKTEEHLGFTGSLEGIKSLASCLVMV